MNFEAVLRILADNFRKYNISFALIGGFAMHAAGYTRATQDIDFLILKKDVPKIKKIMSTFGYELVHESEDVSNFVGKMKDLGKVDFLHAHRAYAQKMLERAKETDMLNGQFKARVILPEDIIGLKVQSSSNQPERHHQDMADIEYLLRTNVNKMNMDSVREYFRLFDRTRELEAILKRIKHDD